MAPRVNQHDGKGRTTADYDGHVRLFDIGFVKLDLGHFTNPYTSGIFVKLEWPTPLSVPGAVKTVEVRGLPEDVEPTSH